MRTFGKLNGGGLMGWEVELKNLGGLWAGDGVMFDGLGSRSQRLGRFVDRLAGPEVRFVGKSTSNGNVTTKHLKGLPGVVMNSFGGFAPE
jgi:hypothetical protein